jgi:hypothetical protein
MATVIAFTVLCSRGARACVDGTGSIIADGPRHDRENRPAADLGSSRRPFPAARYSNEHFRKAAIPSCRERLDQRTPARPAHVAIDGTDPVLLNKDFERMRLSMLNGINIQ